MIRAHTSNDPQTGPTHECEDEVEEEDAGGLEGVLGSTPSAASISDAAADMDMASAEAPAR